MSSKKDYSFLDQKAQRLGGFRFKKDAVIAALKEFVEKRKQMEIIGLFGKVELDPTYDPKKGRSR